MLTEIFGATASENIKSLNTLLNNETTQSLILNIAATVDTLTDPQEQFAAEKLLAFYLDPNATKDNEQQRAIFTAWTGLITTLDKTHYPESIALLAAMSAKFEYVDLNAPLHQSYRTFRRAIAEPHNQAYAAHLATFGK